MGRGYKYDLPELLSRSHPDTPGYFPMVWNPDPLDTARQARLGTEKARVFPDDLRELTILDPRSHKRYTCCGRGACAGGGE